MATMILIANLAVLMMLPLLTIADPYCTNLVRQCNKNFINKCAHQNFIIQTCCDLQIFSSPTGVYTIRKEQFDTASVYCDMDNDDGGWIVIQRNKNGSTQSFNQNLDSYEISMGSKVLAALHKLANGS